MTQTVFSHVLILALKSLLNPNIGVIQVTGMTPAETNVEVCGEFLRDLNKKIKESKKRERDELSLNPPKEDNEESTYEPIPQPQTKKLKVRSDMVIIRDEVRKNEKNLRKLFLMCDVNIEMKAFESLVGRKLLEKPS
ncbi:expressed unknown protein [Seminavis robusta]|uniref:Uncharacterized protein n=1 Tax=Seminavis robusta TaxID=568900 RepID=A0A9N8HVN4_9STRA|nr:expressed unknown protein [Seminavis robusta]|eukprot:Sro1977_g308920.1 n/a (137) ;mRNA; f:8862-9272